MENSEIFKLDVVSVRLVKDAPIFSTRKIQNPEDAVDLVGKMLCEMDREIACIINLKTDGTPINCHIASIGALNQAMVHPRELFKSSILSNAASIMLVHCHPSQNLKPSKEDTRITDRMIKLTELMGIPLLDHIIVGGDNRKYFSFREKCLMTNPSISYNSNYETLEFSNSTMVAEKGKSR